MNLMIRFFSFFFFFFAILFVDLQFLQAEDASSKTEVSYPVILDVQVKGNRAISSATILSKIKSKPGSRFSQNIVNEDIKRLYALGYFTDVAIDIQEVEEGILLTIIVEEKAVVREVIFEGNKKIRTRTLRKRMQTKEGDMLNYGKLSDDMLEIRSFYESRGFSNVVVNYQIELDEESNEAIVRIIIDEKTRVRIKRVYIQGNKSIKTKKIRSLMKTRPAWLFSRGYLDEGALEDDVARIEAYYKEQGFLDVRVKPSLEVDEKTKTMKVFIKIDEGRQYIVKEIVITGKTVFPEKEIRKQITVKEDKPLNFSEVRESMENIRAMYYKRGYMNVELFVDREFDPRTNSVKLTFDIDAGDIVYVGKINIRGNTKTKDVVIRRELRIYPGEKFDGDKIRRSKERLYNLGFFEDVYFETNPTGDPNVNDLNVTVKEAKTGEFSFGGGYSSVDEFIGFIQIAQRNFDIFNFPYFTGDGQNLIIRAELGTTRNDYDISWTEPWIFDYPLSFGFDVYHRTHFRRTHVGYGYREIRSGGDVRFGKEFMEYLRSDLVYKLERVDISDVSSEASKDLRDEEGSNWLSTILLGTRFDNRDNIYNPTKGVVVGCSIENAGGFLLGDKDFLKGEIWSSYFYSPIRNIVIELRWMAGLVDSYGDSGEVPIYERFYAGGANTIRGYRERKVGPRDPGSNDPVGGESIIVGTAEITFPIYENVLKGAVFYDIGNVWRRVGDFGQGGYKSGVGVGARVKTPIGPIRIDWGYPLNENEGDPREGQFYFSVSRGF